MDTKLSKAISKIENEILSSLSKKYKESFQIEKLFPRNILDSQVYALTYADLQPDLLFDVIYSLEHKKLSDNYVGHQYANELAEAIGVKFSQYSSNFSLFVIFSNDYDINQSSLQQFIDKNKNISIRIYAHYTGSDLSVNQVSDILQTTLKEFNIQQIGQMYFNYVTQECLIDIENFFTSNTKPDYNYESLLANSKKYLFEFYQGMINNKTEVKE